MLRFELCFSENAYDALVRVTKRERDSVREICSLICCFPEMAADRIVPGSEGGEVYYKETSRFEIKYLVDHAVREVRIIDFARRRPKHKKSLG